VLNLKLLPNWQMLPHFYDSMYGSKKTIIIENGKQLNFGIR